MKHIKKFLERYDTDDDTIEYISGCIDDILLNLDDSEGANFDENYYNVRRTHRFQIDISFQLERNKNEKYRKSVIDSILRIIKILGTEGGKYTLKFTDYRTDFTTTQFDGNINPSNIHIAFIRHIQMTILF